MTHTFTVGSGGTRYDTYLHCGVTNIFMVGRSGVTHGWETESLATFRVLQPLFSNNHEREVKKEVKYHLNK